METEYQEKIKLKETLRKTVDLLRQQLEQRKHNNMKEKERLAEIVADEKIQLANLKARHQDIKEKFAKALED